MVFLIVYNPQTKSVYPISPLQNEGSSKCFIERCKGSLKINEIYLPIHKESRRLER